jgi:NTE family protein
MEAIEKLAENQQKMGETQTIDIVLESGAANGFYQLGILFYLAALERKKIIKINRISGSSIGAIVGFYYFTNSLESLIDDYSKLKRHFKKNLNLSVLKSILKEKIDKLDDKDIEKLNDKLFVVYHNISKYSQTLQSTYKNRDDLLACLLKSAHIPYVTNGEGYYTENNERFIDGGVPHIFLNRQYGEKIKILYVNITHFRVLSGFLSVKNEQNMFERLLKSALDVHKFFVYKKSSQFCSYINDWTMIDYLLLRLKQLFVILCCIVFYLCYEIYNFIKKYFGELHLINFFSPFIENIIRDTLLFYCV